MMSYDFESLNIGDVFLYDLHRHIKVGQFLSISFSFVLDEWEPKDWPTVKARSEKVNHIGSLDYDLLFAAVKIPD